MGGLSFFEAIEGVTEYVENKKEGADISGIVTNDKTGEITIKLTEKNGQFLYILAFPSAGLVPSKTPSRSRARTAAGSRRLRVRGGLGRAEPGMGHGQEQEFRPRGNPKGNVDKITVVLIKSQARQAEDVISGKLDWMLDEPSTDLLPRSGRSTPTSSRRTWPIPRTTCR